MTLCGKKAPDFILKNQDEKEIHLSDFKGKWIILYFYPKDNTSGCTIEALDFTSLKNEFEKENAIILGVSKDSCTSHQKFIKDQKLNIMLLSDDKKEVQQSYGVLQQKKFLGKLFMGTVRSTFLIDQEQIIKHEWINVNAKGHAKEVLETLRKYHF